MVWILLACGPAALAVAYGAAFTATLGWVIFLAGLVVVAILVVLGSPVITVTNQAVTAGRATLPRWAIASSTPLTVTRSVAGEPNQVTLRDQLRSTATAFTVVRAWSGGTGVRIDLADPDDPHPCWLISSRRPVEFAQILQ